MDIRSSWSGHPATIKVRVQPKASSNQVGGFKEDVLYVNVTASPERVRANYALVGLLAEKFWVSPSRVRVLKGQTSRDNLVVGDSPRDDDVRAYITGERV